MSIGIRVINYLEDEHRSIVGEHCGAVKWEFGKFALDSRFRRSRSSQRRDKDDIPWLHKGSVEGYSFLLSEGYLIEMLEALLKIDLLFLTADVFAIVHTWFGEQCSMA